MSTKNQIDKLLISLDIEDKNALFIIMAKDGTLCRRGNGSITEREMPLLKTTSYDGHFEAMMMTVQEKTLAFAGVYEQEPILGKNCKLMIVFNGSNELDLSFKCSYGQDSQGPPSELAQMIINAVKITDPWYHEERVKILSDELLQKTNPANDKQWWEVWK